MTTLIKQTRPLGAYQRDMIDSILSGGNRCHIQRDPVSRRVASSLEARGIIKVDRAYECWIVRVKKEFLEISGKLSEDSV